MRPRGIAGHGRTSLGGPSARPQGKREGRGRGHGGCGISPGGLGAGVGGSGLIARV